MNFLKLHYEEVVRRDLILTEVVETTFHLSAPTKFILSTGGENINEVSTVSSLFVLKHLTSYDPYIIRQDVYNLNKGEAVGGKLTLRKSAMYNLLFRLSFEILPQQKYFDGFKWPSDVKCFSFVIKDVLDLGEFNFALLFLESVKPLQCQLHCSTKKRNSLVTLSRGLLLGIK